MTTKIGLLFLAALVTAGIYVMPNVIATFYGTHTWEANYSGSTGMRCGACHQYIVNEMQNAKSTAWGSVTTIHLGFANGTWGAGYMALLGLPNAAGLDTICIMCHSTNVTVSGRHTQVIVRPCTDKMCHGNATTAGPSILWPNSREAGLRLGNMSAEAHSSWFRNLTQTAPNTYTDASGNKLTTDYYACMGCHTHVGLDFNITRWQKYKLTIDKTGAYSLDVAINTTSTNTSVAYGSAGTKWN